MFRTLAEKYNVSGIPALIVVKSDGTLITANARSDVQVGPWDYIQFKIRMRISGCDSADQCDCQMAFQLNNMFLIEFIISGIGD